MRIKDENEQKRKKITRFLNRDPKYKGLGLNQMADQAIREMGPKLKNYEGLAEIKERLETQESNE